MLNKNEIIELIEGQLEKLREVNTLYEEFYSEIDIYSNGELKALNNLLVVINNHPDCDVRDIILETETRIEMYDEHITADLALADFDLCQELIVGYTALKNLLKSIRGED